MSSQQRKENKILHKFSKQLWKKLVKSKVEIDPEGYIYVIDGGGQHADRVLVGQLHAENLLYRNIFKNYE